MGNSRKIMLETQKLRKLSPRNSRRSLLWGGSNEVPEKVRLVAWAKTCLRMESEGMIGRDGRGEGRVMSLEEV